MRAVLLLIDTACSLSSMAPQLYSFSDACSFSNPVNHGPLIICSMFVLAVVLRFHTANYFLSNLLSSDLFIVTKMLALAVLNFSKPNYANAGLGSHYSRITAEGVVR